VRSRGVDRGKAKRKVESEFVGDKFRSEIACGGEIPLRRMKCFVAQNVKYFICDEMLWTGFARTHYIIAGCKPRIPP
jgi:hypothetical protein